MASVRISAGAARLGLVAAGVAAALAMASGPSAAQNSGTSAPPSSASPAQSSAAPSSAAQSSAAPSAAAPAPGSPAGGAPDAAKLAKGREVFDNYGCSSCHSLAAAGATGHVGPAFDGDSNLTVPFVIDRVTNGQGAMPSFGGQMSNEEIADVAAYVVHAASK